jgi:hypothetical protein
VLDATAVSTTSGDAECEGTAGGLLIRYFKPAAGWLEQQRRTIEPVVANEHSGRTYRA